MPIVNPAAKRGSTKAAINASTSTGAAIYPRGLGLPAYYRSGITEEPLAKLRRGSARFVASGDSASAILRDCSGIAWYSAASEQFWVTSGKPMAALPRNGGKALMSCLGANALR
jgi:hypothetical protein